MSTERGEKDRLRLSPPWLPLVARVREDESQHRQATWVELFFDLCFVVSIAAIARAFHGEPTLEGALIAAGLFVPLWWGWMGYTWFANTFDNDDVLYRALTFAGMLSVLFLAASISGAFDGDTTPYVLGYVALRGSLLVLMLRARAEVSATAGENEWIARGFLNRYIAGNALGLGVWLGSLAVAAPGRYWVWALGLAIELITPFIAVNPYWSDERRHGVLFHLDHVQERYGLFSIIVLGESILAVSIGVEEVGWSATTVLTAGLAFLVAVSVWWTYFDRSGRTALEGGPGVSFIWGYGHLVIFGGIAALGVGTELLIELEGEHGGGGEGAGALLVQVASGGEGVPTSGAWIFTGGLIAFLLGMTLINQANLGFRLSGPAMIGIPLRVAAVAMLVLAAATLAERPLLYLAVAAATMLVVNVAETAIVLGLRGTPPPRRAATDPRA